MGTFVKGINGRTDATGWASYNFTGGGPTRIICVSNAGVDSGSGTFAAPYLTLAHATAVLGGLGNGEYWLLARKGDTFLNDTFGAVSWPKGTSATNPIVVSSYDGSIDPATSGFNPSTGGARPIIKIDVTAADHSLIQFQANPNGGTNTAIIGLDYYPYKRDPNNVAFAPLGERLVGGGCGQTFHDLYWEDVRFQYCYGGLDFTITTFDATNLTIRRCQFGYTWNYDSGSTSAVHVAGVSGTIDISENVFVMNGWLQALQTPQTVSITNASPAVISWLGSYNCPFAGGSKIFFLPSTGGSDVLPTGITSGGTGTNGQPAAGDVAPHQVYYVDSYTPGSPPTFKISNGDISTLGAIATAGSGGSNGTYTNVQLYPVAWQTPPGSFASGQRATIVVSGGAVTSVTLTSAGTGCYSGEMLTADVGSPSLVTGFTIPVSSVNHINTSSAGTGTPRVVWYYIEGSQSLNHNFYLQGGPAGSAGDPATVTGNISAYDNSGSQVRSGYAVDNNLWLRNPYCHNIGQPDTTVGPYTVTNNVYLEAVGLPYFPSPDNNDYGFGLGTMNSYSFQQYFLKPLAVTGNVFANKISGAQGAISIATGQDGDTVTSNIIYNWSGTAIDLGTGAPKTFTLNAAGSGGTGAIANFETASMVNGSGGVDGTYAAAALTGGTGSGATANITVVGGSVPSPTMAGAPPPYTSNMTSGGHDWGNGGVKLVSGGSGYSSGDVLSCSVSGVPANFRVTVGPYPDYTLDTGQGVTMNGGVGAGAQCFIFFATSGGVTRATSATPFYNINNYNSGFNYAPGDVLSPSAAVSGITGAAFNVATVTSNTQSSNQIDTAGANNNTGGTAPAEPFPAPSQSVGGYYASIGSPGGFASTTDGFLSAVLNNNKSNWNANLTANAVNTYIRAGFGIGSFSAPSTQRLIGAISM